MCRDDNWIHKKFVRILNTPLNYVDINHLLQQWKSWKCWSPISGIEGGTSAQSEGFFPVWVSKEDKGKYHPLFTTLKGWILVENFSCVLWFTYIASEAKGLHSFHSYSTKYIWLDCHVQRQPRGLILCCTRVGSTRYYYDYCGSWKLSIHHPCILAFKLQVGCRARY